MRKRRKLKKANDADVCYAIVAVYLDGKIDNLEMADDINPTLRKVLQKIAALKAALAVACRLGELDREMIEREALEWVQDCYDRRLRQTSIDAESGASASDIH